MVIGSSGLISLAVTNLVGKEGVTEPLKALFGKEPITEVRADSALRAIEEPPANKAVIAPLKGTLSGRIEERVGLDKVALAVIAALPKKSGAEEAEEKKIEPELVAGPYTYKLLLESMTGRKLKVIDLDRTESEDVDLKAAETGKVEEEEKEATGAKVEYNFKEVTIEEQHLLFKAGGTVRTASGALRGFSIKLRMSRSQYFESTAVGFAGVEGQSTSVDPLVTSFTTGSASVTAEKRLFDLEPDFNSKSVKSKSANVPAVLPAPGSMVLVYDKSPDGVLNSGGEDFSLSGGNELAPYGSEQEYWIDEKHPVYNSLRAVVEGPNGEDTLVSLKEAGIAAISLKYTDSTLFIKDNANNIDTEVRRTGFFLNAKYGGVVEPQVDFIV